MSHATRSSDANQAAPHHVGSGAAKQTVNDRRPAIDLLRGLAVIGMILVAYAGDWDHRFTVLTHTEWRGFAIADMIFPSFLFCVGIVLPFSLERRLRAASPAQVYTGILRRGAALFGLGLLLQLLPFFDFSTVRVMGILQRIGLCYVLAGFIVLALGTRGPLTFTLPLGRAIAAAAIVALGYAALLLWWDAPECGRACFDSVHALPAVIDRAVLGVHHMWPYGTTNGIVTYEPEGLISTLGSLINVLIGVSTGLVLQRGGGTHGSVVLRLVLAGVVLLVGGLLMGSALPVVKKIWTPSFAVLSAGFSLLCLSGLLVLTAKARFAGTPIKVFGVNATLAFIVVSLLDVLLQFPFSSLPRVTLHDTFTTLLGSVIPDARVASVTYSLVLLGVVGLLLWPLLRKGIYFRL